VFFLAQGVGRAMLIRRMVEMEAKNPPFERVFFSDKNLAVKI
jgi:hypothetical protein